jgi:hypothetical protein
MTVGKSYAPFQLCILNPSNSASCALITERREFAVRNSFVASFPKK